MNEDEYKVGERVRYVGPHYYQNAPIGHASLDNEVGNTDVVKGVLEMNGRMHVDIFGFWVDIRGVEPLVPRAAPVTDEEVAELFHLKPSVEIDWRKLLKEYVDAVADYEGVGFMNKIKVNWTDAEWEAVHELWVD